VTQERCILKVTKQRAAGPGTKSDIYDCLVVCVNCCLVAPTQLMIHVITNNEC